MSRFEKLAVLCHHRWAVPVLGELHRLGGAKFVTLAHRLGVSRDTLRCTLDALLRQGWVERNPGYGHPMRPEYVLTAAGAHLAPACARLAGLLGRLGLAPVALRKWSLPVILALRRSGGRFNEVKALLPGITARALALALKALQGARLVERRVEAEYPPRTSYELTPRGRRLVSALEGL
jgi:DNA-binding HxlR family transcriptional regulator